MMGKEELRTRALEARRSLGPAAVSRLSAAVERTLVSLPEFRAAQTLAAYVAKEDEVQTMPIIERALAGGKRVLVPRVDPSKRLMRFYPIRSVGELAPGTFGVLEPGGGSPAVPLDESQLVLVPVVAWDDRGHRLGYGKGYFDSELPKRGGALAVGLAVEAQHVERVPESSSDVPMDAVVTERRVVRFGGRPG